jgi:hypothetical protein
MEEVEERIESSEITVKVRKLHSDTGQSRGGKHKASGKVLNDKPNAQVES